MSDNLAIHNLRAFDVRLEAGRAVSVPSRGPGPADRPMRLEPGPGDVLVGTAGRPTRFLQREPLHEELVIEVGVGLRKAEPGVLVPVTYAIYRAGTDRVLCLASTMIGNVVVIAPPDEHMVTVEVDLPAMNVEVNELGAEVQQVRGRLTCRWA